MTSSALPAERTKHPRRRATTSPLRRLSRNVLEVGTVLAVLAAFGPPWAVRTGLVVAVVAAVVACLTAWREVAEAQHAAAVQLLAANKAHGAALTAERRLNAGVLDTLTARLVRSARELVRLRDRLAALDATVEKLTGTIATLSRELQSVRAQHAQARAEIRRDHEVIDDLQQTVRSREAELAARSTQAGQVRSIPRRVLVVQQDGPETEDELRADFRSPDLTDLVFESVVLPNYEGDRKLA